MAQSPEDFRQALNQFQQEQEALNAILESDDYSKEAVKKRVGIYLGVEKEHEDAIRELEAGNAEKAIAILEAEIAAQEKDRREANPYETVDAFSPSSDIEPVKDYAQAVADWRKNYAQKTDRLKRWVEVLKS